MKIRFALLLILVGSISVPLVTSMVHAQTTGKDLMIVFKDARTNPAIAKFTLNGTNYLELCASGKCSIKYEISTSPYVTIPTPDNQYMSYSIDFKLIDKVPQNDVGPKKKEFLEKFALSLYACHIDNIVEDNNQELYYCHDTSNLVRSFDSKSWGYETIGIYDAKANTLTFIGNYTGTS